MRHIDDAEAATHPEGGLAWKLRPGNSGLLVVVFSQVRVPEGKFGLERLFARTRHTCLFLNDLRNEWYLEQEDRIDDLIARALAEVPAKRIVYYGSSMGGYGALATALRRRDGELHAFGTELQLGLSGYQSAALGLSPDDPRLKHQSAPSDWQEISTQSKYHFYYGCLDPVDALNAALCAQWFPGASLYLLTSTHASHDHLYSLNLIRRLIMTFCRDPAEGFAEKGLLSHCGLSELAEFGRLAEQFSSGAPVGINDLSRLPSFQTNPGMLFFAASCLARAEEYGAALELLEKAERLCREDATLATLPKRWRKKLPLDQVHLLRKLGEEDKARKVLAAMMERFPQDDVMRSLADELGTPSLR